MRNRTYRMDAAVCKDPHGLFIVGNLQATASMGSHHHAEKTELLKLGLEEVGPTGNGSVTTLCSVESPQRLYAAHLKW